MAYYNEDDDQQLLQQQQGDQESQPQTLSSQSSAVGGTSTPQGQTSAPQNQGTATQNQNQTNHFAGIQDYLDANKGQTQNMANQLAGSISQSGVEAQNQMAATGQQFQSDVAQNTVNLDNDLLGEVQSNASQVAQDADKKQQFQNMYNANYSGPSNIQTYANLADTQKSIADAKVKGEQAQNEAGSQSLIADLQKEQRGRVHQGSNTLNTALLRGDQQARDTVTQAGRDLSGLDDVFNSWVADQNAYAQSGRDTTEATRQAVQQAVNPLQSQIYSGIQDRQQELSARDTQLRELENALRSGNISDQQLQQLGITRANWNDALSNQETYSNLYRDVQAELNLLPKDLRALMENISTTGTPQSVLSSVGDRMGAIQQVASTFGDKQNLMDTTNYIDSLFNNDYMDANAVATEEEMAQFMALNDLLGIQNSALNDPSRAGTIQDPSLNFNYDDWISNILTQVDSLSGSQQQLKDIRGNLKKNTKVNRMPPSMGR